MKSAAKIVSAPSKYNWSFLLFLLFSVGLLQSPNLPHQCVKLRLGHQGISWPCLRHRAPAHHTVWILLPHAHTLSYRQLQHQPTSLTCVSAFFSLTVNVQFFSAFLNITIYFTFSLEKSAQTRACAVSTASLLPAEMGMRRDVVREDTLETGREYVLCFFFMLNTLQVTAQVKDSNTSAAFNILNWYSNEKVFWLASFLPKRIGLYMERTVSQRIVL